MMAWRRCSTASRTAPRWPRSRACSALTSSAAPGAASRRRSCFRPCSSGDWLLAAVEELLEALPLVIESFNRALARLRAEGIHPGLPARPSGYLPLFYACASDGRRLRLWRAIEGGEQVALARCNACGIEYRFRLGRSGRSMAELAAAGRWSPDLCWLLLLRERISGYVAGASSAVYGLVLQAVATEVFGRPLPPVHVPEAIARDTASAAVDSLLHAACPPPPAAEEGVRWRLAG